MTEWAIENEVNNTAQWAGTPEEYAALVTHAAGVIRDAQPDAVILDSGLSSPTMGTGIVLDLLRQGKKDEALAAYQRYYARRHTSRTRDYPALTTVAELEQLAATDKWRYNDAMIETTFGLAKDRVIDRLQMHFYERWDAAPLLVELVRSRIPADMPIEAWEVGLFDVDETKSEAVLSEEVTKTVSQLLAYGVARVLWLPLAADPNGTGGEEKRFGLLEPDGTPAAGGRCLPAAGPHQQRRHAPAARRAGPARPRGPPGRQGHRGGVGHRRAGRGRLGRRCGQRARRHHHDGHRRHRHRHQPGDDRGPGAAGGRAGRGARMTGPELLDGKTGVRRVAFEVRRHARWAREEGFGKLVEEDQLNVFERAPVAARKLWWRSTHGVGSGLSTPVFLFGVQRSGTNMVVRGLERSPEFAVHNENDRRVFVRYELRSMSTVRQVVERSHARYTLFKPLCDSHRADQLLDQIGTTMPPRAIWAYRGMEGRVRSSLSKFRDHNLTVLADVAAGRLAGSLAGAGHQP